VTNRPLNSKISINNHKIHKFGDAKTLQPREHLTNTNSRESGLELGWPLCPGTGAPNLRRTQAPPSDMIHLEWRP